MHFKNKKVLVIDFETYYNRKDRYDLRSISMTEYIRDPRFKVQGFAYRWMHEEMTHWVSGDHVIQAWMRSIDWSTVVVVAQNVRFDGGILGWRYGVKPHMWFDTKGLARAILANNIGGYSLREVGQYLGLQPKGELKWDGIRDLTPQQEEEMAVYCKGDVDICKGIYEKLIEQFPEGQTQAMDWTIRAFLEPKLRLDVQTLEEGVQKETERRETLIQQSGVDKTVLSSNKQFAEYLQQQGYTVPTKISGRTGKQIPAFARTDDGLADLERISPKLYAARIASKANLLETRGTSLLAVAKTGSFPFDVGFSGAVQTHRYSGGSGAGGNPQNFTRKSFLREAVCAPEGRSLIVGDFSAIELRILAWLAKEPKLVNSLINGTDVYSEFASWFYRKPVPPKESTPERHFGKTAILGLGYGMGGTKFKKTADIELKKFVEGMKGKGHDTTGIRTEIAEGEAYAAIKFYRTTYFNVPRLWEQCGNLIPCIASGQIASLHFAPFIKVRRSALLLPSGLAIQYPNLRRVEDEWVYDVYKRKGEAEPSKLYGGKLVENICQGLAGELCKEAITRIETDGYPCVGAVHDEILALGPPLGNNLSPEEAVRHVKESIEQSPKWWPELKLKAEVGYGSTWNGAKS